MLTLTRSPPLTRGGSQSDMCHRTIHRTIGFAHALRHQLRETDAATDLQRWLSAKSTPIPFAYTLLLHRTAYLYCFLLPFGLVDQIGFMTPFVVAIVAYTFFGLDALGVEIEEPFGLRTHHLPLDTLCRMLEINLLEALGAAPLPPPLTPVEGRLH